MDQSIARELRLSPADAQMARVLAARVAVRLSPDTQFAFALSQGSSGLVAQMQGQARPAFLIASNAAGENGFLRSTDTSMALRQQVGEWGLTVSAESGEAWLGQTDNANILDAQLNRRQPVRVFGAAADRRFGQVEAALGLSWMSEGNTVLGAWLHDAIGGSGSDTLFADARIGFGFAQRWRLGGEFRQGFTRARQSGFVGNGSTFASDAWSIDMTRSDTLTAGDTLGLRVSQPLRVSGGGLNLDLPVSYDYVTESAILGVRRVSLSPDGRELMGELAWRGALWNGQGALSLFYREDPGHYATTPDDKGVAISWSRAF